MDGDADAKIGRSKWGEFSVPDEKPPIPVSKGNVLLEFKSRNTPLMQKSVSTTSLASSSNHEDEEELESDEISMGDQGIVYANSLQESIVAQVTKQKDVFFKSQQRGEPALTSREKRKIALELLQASPSLFLSRYGGHLEQAHFEYFHQFEDNYEVKFYLQKFENAKETTSTVKNRRYHALKALIKEGEYFSMPQMKERNPMLFDRLVGKYMSEEDKNAMDPRPNLCSLSTVLMAHAERDEHSSQRRKDQLAEELAWGEEESSSDEEESDTPNEDEKKIMEDEFVSSKYKFKS